MLYYIKIIPEAYIYEKGTDILYEKAVYLFKTI